MFSILSGWIYKNIIDTLGNNAFSVNTRFDIVFMFVISLGLCFLLGIFMSRWGDYTYFRFLTKAEKELFDFGFDKLINQSYSFFSNNFAGSLVTKIKRFSNALNTLTEAFLYNFWPTILMLVLSFVVLFNQSKMLSFYFLSFAICFVSMSLFFAKQRVKLDIESAKADSLLTGVLSDNISNVLNLKIFSASEKEKENFGEVTENLKQKVFNSLKFMIVRNSLQGFLMILFHILVLLLMINLWKKGEITIGTFIMVYTYMQAIFDRMWDISHGINRFTKALTDAKEGVDIFDQKLDVEDKKQNEELKIKEGNILFKNMSFGYSEDKGLFDDFNLEIKSGEKVGLVGHSGSGKSTITKILLRFININKGEILIDGQDISNLKQDDLRSVISYVPQESILFHRSIKENIKYSRPDATDEEMIEAAKKAFAHDFIVNLPNGYDTLVGERGVKLSGGERQRVSIARAILKNAPILILDEATSALDSVSEFYIQEAFKELMKGKTTIVIAHRLSTIQKMDRIVLLEEGKIIEDGNHASLILLNGKYKDLWDHQTGGFIEE